MGQSKTVTVLCLMVTTDVLCAFYMEIELKHTYKFCMKQFSYVINYLGTVNVFCVCACVHARNIMPSYKELSFHLSTFSDNLLHEFSLKCVKTA
jgi:hypothetical protein